MEFSFQRDKQKVISIRKDLFSEDKSGSSHCHLREIPKTLFKKKYVC